MILKCSLVIYQSGI